MSYSEQPSYRATDGDVYVLSETGWKIVTTAVTANGRDVARFESCRVRAAAQRPNRAIVKEDE